MILIWLGHRIIGSRSQNRTEYYQRPPPLHITAKKQQKWIDWERWNLSDHNVQESAVNKVLVIKWKWQVWFQCWALKRAIRKPFHNKFFTWKRIKMHRDGKYFGERSASLCHFCIHTFDSKFEIGIRSEFNRCTFLHIVLPFDIQTHHHI